MNGIHTIEPQMKFAASNSVDPITQVQLMLALLNLVQTPHNHTHNYKYHQLNNSYMNSTCRMTSGEDLLGHSSPQAHLPHTYTFFSPSSISLTIPAEDKITGSSWWWIMKKANGATTILYALGTVIWTHTCKKQYSW